ncbi:MAG: type II secretion system protein GspM [Nitrospirota bacterium]
MIKIVGNIIKTLSFRERIFLIGGGVLIIFTALYFLFVSPIMERTATLDRLIIQKENNVKEIISLNHEYIQLKERISGIGKKLSSIKKGFSLLSYIEDAAKRNNIREHISYIRPQNTTTIDNYKIISVDVKIDNVTLKEIVNFLSFIENSPHLLKVKRIRFKTRYSDTRYLNSTFTISTYEKIS